MAGRKPKGYHATDGRFYLGISHDSDDRFRIVSTGQKFSDEAKAIQAYLATCPRESIFLSVKKSIHPIDIVTVEDEMEGDPHSIQTIDHPNGEQEIGYHLDKKAVWDWVRLQLIERPEYVAKEVRIPQLATLATWDLPKTAIRISEITKAYRAHSNALHDGSKEKAVKAFERLGEFAGGSTLADITEDVLVEFRKLILREYNSSGAIAQYFSTIRGVLRIAMRSSLDKKQIEQCVLLCKSKLYSPTNNTKAKPQPISRENFHALLDAAAKSSTPGTWRAILLLALNAALYMEDICSLKWEHIDLEKGELDGYRQKKGQCQRCAVLWKETIEALRALPKTNSEFVFVSTTGTRYNRNSRMNAFAELRAEAKVPDSVTFSHLRDGAFTTAANAPIHDGLKFARLLAGHSMGTDDAYVHRSPQAVIEVCEIVHNAYLE